MTADLTAPADRITSVIAELLGVDPSELVDAKPIADLVADSIMLIELAVELQDRFDLLLFQEDLERVVTMHDLRELIRARI